VLQPSLNEVLPLCICEAMAFERPVIATRIDGIPEAIDDQKEGLLIPPADEVQISLKFCIFIEVKFLKFLKSLYCTT
jgi:glycosyltransferase involved in cell wall biosynthesis